MLTCRPVTFARRTCSYIILIIPLTCSMYLRVLCVTCITCIYQFS